MLKIGHAKAHWAAQTSAEIQAPAALSWLTSPGLPYRTEHEVYSCGCDAPNRWLMVKYAAHFPELFGCWVGGVPAPLCDLARRTSAGSHEASLSHPHSAWLSRFSSLRLTRETPCLSVPRAPGYEAPFLFIFPFFLSYASERLLPELK